MSYDGMSYGFTIRWLDFWGNWTSVSVTGAPDLKTARLDAIERALASGWRPRRWWQWWRWTERDVMLTTEEWQMVMEASDRYARA